MRRLHWRRRRAAAFARRARPRPEIAQKVLDRLCAAAGGEQDVERGLVAVLDEIDRLRPRENMHLGGQGASSDERPAVLLTIEGVDSESGLDVDIEIAVSVDHVDRLITLLQSRKKGWGGNASA